jgi:dipeptidyl aminopeptidase/acylaminoacyl peptidase
MVLPYEAVPKLQFLEQLPWIYNVDTGQALKSIATDEESGFGNVTYSHDGNCIVALYGARTNRKVKIFDAETGQELRIITAEGNFSSAVYSPDGKHLLVRYRDNNRNYIVKILDAETGRELRTLTTQDYMFSWSPDGKRIISVPGTVYEGNDPVLAASWATVWDASSGRKFLTIGYGPLNAGARAYADMQLARFLGDTAAVGRHEGIIKFITDRGNATRAEVETFYRQNIGSLIAEVVNEEFNTIKFSIDRTNGDIYGTVLTRNAQNHYVLSYEGYFNGTQSTRTLPPAFSLEALSSAMSNSGDFSAAAFNVVHKQAALIPAVALAQTGTTDAFLGTVKKALTDFYVSPTTANYNTVKDIYALFMRRAWEYHQDPLFEIITSSYSSALGKISIPLANKVRSEANQEKYAASTLTQTQIRDLEVRR